MPRTKLVFVKLMLDLADDERFIMRLDDSQKLDYLLLLLMAGLTHNEIPLNFRWLKARFCLQKSEQELQKNLDCIRATFKKFVVYRGKLKFKNFKDLHNYIYKEEGNDLGILKEYTKDSTNKVNFFLIISNIISYYIYIKEWKEADVDIKERNRYGKRIKRLLVLAKANSDLVKKAIAWTSRQNYIDWTLETTISKWADFMKYHNMPDILKKHSKDK